MSHCQLFCKSQYARLHYDCLFSFSIKKLWVCGSIRGWLYACVLPRNDVKIPSYAYICVYTYIIYIQVPSAINSRLYVCAFPGNDVKIPSYAYIYICIYIYIQVPSAINSRLCVCAFPGNDVKIPLAYPALCLNAYRQRTCTDTYMVCMCVCERARQEAALMHVW